MIKNRTLTSTPNKNKKINRILKAARKIIAKKGYDSATIKVIADEANVSRGLLHYHFKNKEEIIREILDNNVETTINRLDSMFKKSSSLDTLVDELAIFIRYLVRGDSSPLNLFIEGWAYSRRSNHISNSIKEYYHRFRNSIHHGLEKATMSGVIEPEIPMEELTVLFLSFMDGILLQIRNEPDLLSDNKLKSIIKKALHSLLLPC